MYNSHFNNKMPFCSLQREVEPGKLRHFEIKDGKRIWVDGKKVNKYKGLDSSLMGLQERIETGVFENHEGNIRKLEKIEGSDYLQNQLEKIYSEVEKEKSISKKRKLKKEYEEAYNKFLQSSSVEK